MLKPESSAPLNKLITLLHGAQHLVDQKPKDKIKLYTHHAPEVECLRKGKIRQPYKFGVEAGFAVTHKKGLIVGSSTFLGNPYDAHTLAEQLEQAKILIGDHNAAIKQVYVDLAISFSKSS